jgi:hypothetical protein
MAKRTQPSAPPPAASDPRVVTIRSPGDKGVLETPITHPERLECTAQEWGYILRARARWAEDSDLRKSVGVRAHKTLESLGVPRDRFQDLAAADQIEVEFHDWDQQDAAASRLHEAASEVPWEYLISAATRAEGRFQSLLISRLFRNGMTAPRLPHPPASVLFVESAPGRLKGLYEFDGEEERISAAVNAHDRKVRWHILNTPEVSELENEAAQDWEAIHVSGIDTHQAGWLIKETDPKTSKEIDFYTKLAKDKPELWTEITKDSGRLRDGLLLRQGREIERPVIYDKLAKILVGPAPAPRIVTLNLYYSGAHIARELIRLGAHSALGFLDEIDDELAELFFQTFYWKWCHAGRKPLRIPQAFLDAWHEMPSEQLHGTSIVIWMGRSVFDPLPGARARRRTKR